MTGAASDTIAQPGPSPTGGSVDRRRLLLAVGYAVGAAVAAGLAWWLAARGVATDSWPSFDATSTHTDITRYSGAWLTGTAGAMLVAALLLVAAVRQGVRAAVPPLTGGVPTSAPGVAR